MYIEEIKKLNNLKQETINLKRKIEKYSIYNIDDISTIISIIMTKFENIEYIPKKEYSPLDTNVIITEKEKHNTSLHYTIKQDSSNSELITKIQLEKKNKCFLPPEGYIKLKKENSNELQYIQDFLNYLFEKRISNQIENIDLELMEQYLNQYLTENKEKIEIRNISRQKKEQMAIRQKEKNNYQKQCMIDRKSFLNAVNYIINNYENENLSSEISISKEWNRTNEQSTLFLYNNLKISTPEKVFNTLIFIGADVVYPDEEDCAYVNPNQKTEINFFDTLISLPNIIRNCEYLSSFLTMIENEYTTKKVLESKDIELILIKLSNINKDNKQKYSYQKT